MFASLF
jgi:hypothetical protein